MEYSIIASILGCRRATLSEGSKRWILITWVVPQAVVPFHFVLISFCVSVSRNANMKNTCQRFSVLPVHTAYIVPAHVYGEKNQRFVSSNIFACFIMGILEKIAEIESEVFILCLIYKSSLS